MFGLIRIKAFADEMKVPPSTVYSWRREGVIPPSCFKPIGGTLYVKVKEMQNWIDNNS